MEKATNKEIILGIDPGTCVTGYAFLKVGPLFEVLDYGCIKPPKAFPLSERYRVIFEAVQELMQLHQPTMCAIETQFVGKNVQSAMKLGMARGMVTLAASLRKIPIFEYAPTRVKQAIVGTGKASKVQIQEMIRRLLCLSVVPTPEDAADALAIALCHGHNLKGRKHV